MPNDALRIDEFPLNCIAPANTCCIDELLELWRARLSIVVGRLCTVAISSSTCRTGRLRRLQYTYVIVVDLLVNVTLAVLTLALAHTALHTFPVGQLEAVRIYTRR